MHAVSHRLTRSFSLLLLAVVSVTTGRAVNQYKVSHVDGGMPYLLHLPADYDATKSYPTLIFLHGYGERCNPGSYGTTNELDLLEKAANTPPKLIAGGNAMSFTVNGKTERLIVISPQIKKNKSWNAADIVALLDEVKASYSVDESRVYLTGFSFGSEGTWAVLTQADGVTLNNPFAAAAPVHGRSLVRSKHGVIANNRVAVWASTSLYDGSVPDNNPQFPYETLMAVRELRKYHPPAEVRLTLYDDNPSYTHSCQREYSTGHTYNNPNLYEWFLSKTLQTPASIVVNNLARLSGVTATAGDASPSYPVTKIKDGYITTSSVWKSPTTDLNAKWAVINLGAVRNVNQILITHATTLNADLFNNNFTTRSFTLEYSLNGTAPWTPLATVVNNYEFNTQHFFAPTPMRYVRLAIQQPNRATGSSESNIYEMEIIEAPVAPPPSLQAVDITATTNEAQPVDIEVPADANGSPFSIQSVGTTPNGATSIIGTQLRYAPNSTFAGTDQFAYTITHGTSTSTATVTVTVNNVLPFAADYTAETDESVPVSVNLRSYSSAPSAFSIESAGPAANGTITNDGSAAAYTPNDGFHDSTDRFAYTIRDASGDTAIGHVDVTVRGTATASNLWAAAGLTGVNVGPTGTGSSRVLSAGPGDWEVTGAGGGLASATADSFHFESADLTGDFQIVLRAKKLTSTGANARAGIMLRESNSPDARMVYLAATTGTNYRFGSRISTGGAVTENSPVDTYAFPDAWLMLERIGNTVRLAVSSDDGSYHDIATVTLTGLSATLKAGVFSSSGAVGVDARAVVANYELTPLATPLVYWKLNETSGTVAADAMGLAKGTMPGAGAFSWTTDGYRYGGLSLGGTNAWVQAADRPEFGGSAFSVSLWFKPALLDGQARGLISKRSNNTSQKAFSIFLLTDNHLFVDIGKDGGVNHDRFDTNFIPALNQWHHLVMVFDGSQSSNRLKMYINGALIFQSQPTVSSIPDTTSLLLVGILNYNYGYGFKGTIDDVRIYNRVLAPANILQLAQ